MICSAVPRRNSRQACSPGDRHHGESRALPTGTGPAGSIHNQHIRTAPETVPAIKHAVLLLCSHGGTSDFVDVIAWRWSVLLSSKSFRDERLHKWKVHLIRDSSELFGLGAWR